MSMINDLSSLFSNLGRPVFAGVNVDVGRQCKPGYVSRPGFSVRLAMSTLPSPGATVDSGLKYGCDGSLGSRFLHYSEPQQ